MRKTKDIAITNKRRKNLHSVMSEQFNELDDNISVSPAGPNCAQE
jgi:hypothetical protein